MRRRHKAAPDAAEHDVFYDPRYDDPAQRAIADTLMDDVPVQAGKKRSGGRQVTQLPRTGHMFARHGWQFSKCETFTPRKVFSGGSMEYLGGTYHDLFGFMDALAYCRRQRGAMAVQVCAKSGILAHIRSAVTNDSGHKTNANRGVALVDWLMAGNRFLIIGWRKLGSRGEALMPGERLDGHLYAYLAIEVTLQLVASVQRGERQYLAKLPVSDLPQVLQA